jgi:hypothetical protein
VVAEEAPAEEAVDPPKRDELEEEFKWETIQDSFVCEEFHSVRERKRLLNSLKVIILFWIV